MGEGQPKQIGGERFCVCVCVCVCGLWVNRQLSLGEKNPILVAFVKGSVSKIVCAKKKNWFHHSMNLCMVFVVSVIDFF